MSKPTLESYQDKIIYLYSSFGQRGYIYVEQEISQNCPQFNKESVIPIDASLPENTEIKQDIQGKNKVGQYPLIYIGKRTK